MQFLLLYRINVKKGKYGYELQLSMCGTGALR